MPARKLLSGLLAAVLFAALPAAAKDIVWKQQTITIAKNPSRIAVYDPAALDILESLGIQTAAYNDGGQPDPAKLAAEPPELIILGGATAGRLKDTAAIAPSLDLTPDTDSYLTDLAARTMLLADIFGKNKAAEQKLKAVSNKRAILKQRTEGKTAVLLLMENGGFIPQIRRRPLRLLLHSLRPVHARQCRLDASFRRPATRAAAGKSFLAPEKGRTGSRRKTAGRTKCAVGKTAGRSSRLHRRPQPAGRCIRHPCRTAKTPRTRPLFRPNHPPRYRLLVPHRRGAGQHRPHVGRTDTGNRLKHRGRLKTRQVSRESRFFAPAAREAVSQTEDGFSRIPFDSADLHDTPSRTRTEYARPNRCGSGKRTLYPFRPVFYSIKPAARQATPQSDMQKGRLKTSASVK